MAAERSCPQCGVPLSAEDLEGLCPRCVGRLAFDMASASEQSGDETRGAKREGAQGTAEMLERLKPEEAGDFIGGYKLMEQIGQGGFGTVWVADQERPVRRRVALKIIKLGMDTKEVIARFEQERQALAMMDHPHIAKVFDAGATQWGRPYFVMELVRGIKITDYCDQAKLSTRERLALFIQVCNAVQHAHQKGVIHRDLKPSNILVTLHDGQPVPKVIDFGVAKATQQQRLSDLTIYTQFQQMIGTPLYMSPEQAEMSGLDIDTRSDIYSLGVLLYELLTGRTPFDPEAMMKAGIDEMRRVIREQEPQTPSMFVRTMEGESRMRAAQRQQTESAKLIALLRGDLDWIVMKALEKDRARRYETANGLALDIRRHLDHEPVFARPPSRLYRFQRSVQRNRSVFASAAAITLTLIVGLAASTTLYFREKSARTLADASLSRLRATAPVFMAQAEVLRNEGKFDEALDKIEVAIELNPHSPDFHLFKANALQTLQRLREASEEYRRVLTYRREDAAQDNLELCERLLKMNGGDGKLRRDVQVQLVEALLAQKRDVDATPLATLLGQANAGAETAILARLKEYTSQPDWRDERLKKLPDGTFMLDFDKLVIGDLTKLKGLPISDVRLISPKLPEVVSATCLPLQSLTARWFPLSDLSILRGLKLRYLDVGGCAIHSLEPLRGMPLEYLHFSQVSRVTDLSPLAGMPLRELAMGAAPCEDLSPLRGLPLESLSIENTPAADLSPLRGLPLKKLRAGKSVLSFEPLRGSPLRELNLADTDEIPDLSPLLDCRELKLLIFRVDCLGLKALRNHPSLTSMVIIRRGGNVWQNAMPVNEFWEKYGARLDGALRVARSRELIEKAIRAVPGAEDYPSKNLHIDANLKQTIIVAEKAPAFDLSVLRGLAIDTLLLEDSSITDLSCLRGTSLRKLVLTGTKVTDLTPLAGMPLEHLAIASSKVTDLSPLRGMPLKRLYADHNPQLTDLSPLKDIPTLEDVLLPSQEAAETLRGLQNIKLIGTEWNKVPDQGSGKPATVFWKEYDGQKR